MIYAIFFLQNTKKKKLFRLAINDNIKKKEEKKGESFKLIVWH